MMGTVNQENQGKVRTMQHVMFGNVVHLGMSQGTKLPRLLCHEAPVMSDGDITLTAKMQREGYDLANVFATQQPVDCKGCLSELRSAMQSSVEEAVSDA